MLSGIPVELSAMLTAREERARQQDAWLKQYQCPLLSFTLNIPGPVKTSPVLRRAFETGLSALQEHLTGMHLSPIAQMQVHAATGDEALVAVKGDAASLKELCIRIEETHLLGRLFDFDVLTADGIKLSRPLPRRCLLCTEQAQVCARSRHHSIEELTNEIERLLSVYFK